MSVEKRVNPLATAITQDVCKRLTRLRPNQEAAQPALQPQKLCGLILLALGGKFIFLASFAGRAGSPSIVVRFHINVAKWSSTATPL